MVIQERFVPARSLASICRQYVNEPIHLLKIDAEGFEREVLLGADFKQYRPWIVVAEATRPLSREISHQFWEGILLSAGYCFRYFDGLNRFYVRADLDHTIGQSFCSPPSVFDHFVRANETGTDVVFDAVQRVADISKQLERYEKRFRELRIKHQEAEARAARWEQLGHHFYSYNQQLLNSTSWKITAPLRNVVTLMRTSLAHWRIRAASRAQLTTRISQRPSTQIALPITIDIIGHINGSYSLAHVNRALVHALMRDSRAAVRLTPIEGGKPASVQSDNPTEKFLLEAATYAPVRKNSKHVALVQHYPLYCPSNRFDVKAAFLFWEESLLPRDMVDTLNLHFDLVLTPTKAVQKAVLDLGVSIPVRTINYSEDFEKFRAIAKVKISAAASNTRSDVVFLHISSCFPRKGVDILGSELINALGRTTYQSPLRPQKRPSATAAQHVVMGHKQT